MQPHLVSTLDQADNRLLLHDVLILDPRVLTIILALRKCHGFLKCLLRLSRIAATCVGFALGQSHLRLILVDLHLAQVAAGVVLRRELLHIRGLAKKSHGAIEVVVMPVGPHEERPGDIVQR